MVTSMLRARDTMKSISKNASGGTERKKEGGREGELQCIYIMQSNTKSVQKKSSHCYHNETVCPTSNQTAKESGLECTCVNNDDFIVLVSGGGRRH